MFKLQTKVPIGYLWKKTDRNGNEFLGGVISLGLIEFPITVFAAPKNSDRSADYIVKIPPEQE